MKKILLSLLMLTCCISMNATKWYATFGTPAGNGTWNAETCSYSWTAAWSNLVTIFDCAGGKLAGYTTLHLTTSDLVTGPYRVCFMNGGDTRATIAFYSEGEKTLDLATRAETKGLDLSTITHISFGGASGAGSVTVKDVYLSKPMAVAFDDNGKYTVDFSDISTEGDVTFDASTGLVTSTGSGNLKINIGEEDFTNVTNITTTIDGTDIVQFFHVGDKVNGTVADYYSSKYNASPDADRKANSGHINSLYYHIDAAGSFTLKSIVITSDVIVGGQIGSSSLKSVKFGVWTTADATATLSSESSPTYSVNTMLGAGGLIYGDGNVYYLNYADLTGYDKLIVTGSAVPRFIFNRSSDGGPTWEVIPGDSNSEYVTQAGNVYTLDLAAIKTAKGFVHLNAIKIPWNGSSNVQVESMMLYKTPAEGSAQYSLFGIGALSTSAKAILNDETATSIDATGITAATTLTPANPNCLFYANEGMLTNSSNVLVYDAEISCHRCANLVLTDKKPFAAPAEFAADNASFTTSLTDAGAATITIPFELASIPEGISAYFLGAFDAGKINASQVDGTKPNQPLLIKGAAGSYTFSKAYASVQSCAAPQEGLLVGTYQPITVPQDMYLLQKHESSVAFYAVPAGGAGLMPFHAYLNTSAGTLGAKVLGINFSDEATRIADVDVDADVDGKTYNLAGQAVGKDYKGIVIVNGKKMLNK